MLRSVIRLCKSSARGGSVTFAVKSGQAVDFPGLTGLLDQEFIWSRGRNTSLAARYPVLFESDGKSEFLVCFEGETITAALALRDFEWLQGIETFQATMVGMVATHPDWRGRGCASQLLNFARQRSTRRGVDFLVLWTSQQNFYARLGWLPVDGGVLGNYRCPEDAPLPSHASLITRAKDCNVQTLESLRHKHCHGHITRNRSNYACLPLSAEDVVVITPAGAEQEAYALIGTAGNTAYVYEMVGNPAQFQTLWASACQRWKVFFINEHEDNASLAWFKENVAVQWEPKPLTMWLPISDRLPAGLKAGWNLTYFDRI